MLTHALMTTMGKIWDIGRRTRSGSGEPFLTASDRASLAALDGTSDAPRHWLHFWYCASERDARTAADRMRDAGWGIRRLGHAAGESGWAVVADRAAAVVDERAVADARRFFTDLAARLHGEYDGWECGVEASAPALLRH